MTATTFAGRLESSVRTQSLMAEAATRRGEHVAAVKWYAMALASSRARTDYLKGREKTYQRMAHQRAEQQNHYLHDQMTLAEAMANGMPGVDVVPGGSTYMRTDCQCMKERDERGVERVVTHSSDCPQYLPY